MAGVNKCIFLGNLGKDPEVRYAKSGSAVCSMSIAVGERVKKGETWEDHTEWVRVTAFGKTAENAGEYLKKGRQVYVEGRLRQTTYQDKDGTEKRSTEIVAETLVFLSSGRDEGHAPKGKRPAKEKADDGFMDDDLPL